MLYKDFQCSPVLSCILYMGLSYLSPGKFSPNHSLLHMPKINYWGQTLEVWTNTGYWAILPASCKSWLCRLGDHRDSPQLCMHIAFAFGKQCFLLIVLELHRQGMTFGLVWRKSHGCSSLPCLWLQMATHRLLRDEDRIGSAPHPHPAGWIGLRPNEPI